MADQEAACSVEGQRHRGLEQWQIRRTKRGRQSVEDGIDGRRKRTRTIGDQEEAISINISIRGSFRGSLNISKSRAQSYLANS